MAGTVIPKIEANTRLFYKRTRYVRHLKKVTKYPKNKVRINSMASVSSTDFAIPQCAPSAFLLGSSHKRRRITYRAGRAMRILRDAIAYLTDEFPGEGATFSTQGSQVQAVQMLMALNRQVYFECPEETGKGERWRLLVNSFLL
jgi:hypothetical protein